MPTASLFDIAVLIVSLFGAGAATGFLAGVFGVGGGAVAVPILYELLRVLEVPEPVRMPLCVGTSLAIIIPTSICSFNAHRAKNAVDMSILKVWAVPVVVGVILGSVIARFAPAEVFKAVFAGVSATRLLFGRDSWRFGLDMPKKPVMVVYGGLIGVLSALMGIGGGQLSNLFMTFYNRPIHQAVATSSGLGVLIAIPGTLGYILAGWGRMADYPDVTVMQPPLALGYVSLIGLLVLVPTSIWLAPIGARLTHRLSKRQLEIAFGLFLALACARFLPSLLF